MKKETRGRKKGSVSFRRVKLTDILDHYNVKTSEPISSSTTIMVSNVWAEMVSIPGVSVSANEELKTEVAKATPLKINLSNPTSL